MPRVSKEHFHEAPEFPALHRCLNRANDDAQPPKKPAASPEKNTDAASANSSNVMTIPKMMR
jgi:hypothetical protein